MAHWGPNTSLKLLSDPMVIYSHQRPAIPQYSEQGFRGVSWFLFKPAMDSIYYNSRTKNDIDVKLGPEAKNKKRNMIKN